MTTSGGVEKLSSVHTDLNQMEYQNEVLQHKAIIYLAILPASDCRERQKLANANLLIVPISGHCM